MSLTRRVAGLILLVGAICATVVATFALPASGQGGSGSEDSAEETSDDTAEETAVQAADGQTKIQVLNVVEAKDGTVIVDVAIPGVIGELAPVEANFGIAFEGRLIDSFDIAPLSTAIDVIIAIDTSGSMRGQPLRDAKIAAASFIDGLPDNADVGVIGFGETVELLAPLTSDRDAALSSIDNLIAVGETRLWDGLVAAAEMGTPPGSVSDASLPYVVVLSDGDDSISDSSQDSAVATVLESQVGLYAIAITAAEDDGAELKQAASSANGIFVSITESSELETLYQRIADRLSSRYQLAFGRDPSSSGTVVISVAVESAIATTRATLQPVEATGAPDPEAPATVLNVPAESQLGTVAIPNPGLLSQSLMLPVGAAAFFAALAILGLLIVNPARDVRLEAAAGADRVAGLNQRLSSLAERFVEKRDEEGELDKALDAAGLNLRPGEFLLIAQVLVIVSAMFGWLVGGLFVAVVTAAIAVIAILFYLSRRATRQRTKFADQLTDTLGILSGSIRAGRGLPQAIELVAAEAPSPTAEQFRRIVFETQVGRDLTQSMVGVAERMKSREFLWIARAFHINRELGGDLTEVLDNIAETIRDRRRVDRMVQALSAEGRASGWLMLALPILMFLFMMWRTPDSISLLITTNLGRTMLAAGIFGMIAGGIWIRKLVDLKY